jgi:hypothetical protein
MNEAQMKAELARLQAENAALKTQAEQAVTCKMTEKGGVSVYGFGRFPITQYPFGKGGEGEGQWFKLFKAQAKVLAFIETNKVELKRRAKLHTETTEALKAAPIVASVKPSNKSAL